LFEVPHDTDDQHWDQWFPGVGGLVMGATTYEWMLQRYGLRTAPTAGMSSTVSDPLGVHASRTSAHSGVDVTLVAGDVRQVYAEIAAKLGDANLWVLAAATS
jgi:hypothetical protein